MWRIGWVIWLKMWWYFIVFWFCCDGKLWYHTWPFLNRKWNNIIFTIHEKSMHKGWTTYDTSEMQSPIFLFHPSRPWHTHGQSTLTRYEWSLCTLCCSHKEKTREGMVSNVVRTVIWFPIIYIPSPLRTGHKMTFYGWRGYFQYRWWIRQSLLFCYVMIISPSWFNMSSHVKHIWRRSLWKY